MNVQRLQFIVGPTASGKTAYALREAQRLGCPILSCDSLCVYRGMDIGTAKPTPAERSQVRHYGLDLADPSRLFSVADYVAYRDRILGELRERHETVLVVGGSGFYLKSFFRPVTDRLAIPQAVRAEVEALALSGGVEALREALLQVNPPGAAFPGLDWNNPRRLAQALVRCRVSGRSFAELLEAFQDLPEPLPGWRKEVVLVNRPPEVLLARNRRRVEAMLETGLVAEVQDLRAAGLEQNPSASRAIGYREVLAHLDGRLSLAEAREQIICHTAQLVRKQRTWFRRQIPVHRVEEP